MKKLIVFIILTIPGLLGAQTMGLTPTLVVNSDKALGYARPRIVLNKSGAPVIIWGRANNKEIYTSTMGSGGFGMADTITPTGVYAAVQSWMGPSIGASGDTLFVAFKSQPEHTGFVYVVRSIDGGITFGDTVRVSSENWSRFAEVSVRPGGHPQVTYMEFDPNFSDPKYVVAVSNDGGMTFSSPVDGSSTSQGEACDCCPGFILAEKQRTVVMFRNNDNNLRDMWATVSTNGGMGFNTGADIDDNNWILNSCPSSGPDAITHKDTLIAVWMSGASGYSKVNIGRADLNNLANNSNSEITPGTFTNQNYPRIAGNGDTIAVVWQEVSAGKIEIKIMASTNGVKGLASASPVAINPSSSNYNGNPDIAYRNGVFHIVWQSNTDQTVYYRTADMRGGVGLNESEKPTIRIYPNPAREYINITVTDMSPGYNYTILNTMGAQIESGHLEGSGTQRIEVSELPPGIYFVRLDDERLSYTFKLTIE